MVGKWETLMAERTAVSMVALMDRMKVVMTAVKMAVKMVAL